MSAKPLTHVLVLGGSAAGLMIAATLARHARRVTLIERDELPDAPEHRKGTPQSHHANNLLARATAFLETILPAVTADLVAAGAVPVSSETQIVLRGVRFVPVDGGPETLLMSRPLLDAVLRQRVRALSNVELKTSHDVTGLTFRTDGSVSGAVLRAPHGGEVTLEADLVVDAMGRGTRATRWLSERGHASPPVTELGVGVRYASRLFERSAGDAGGTKLILIAPTPAIARGGVAFAIEGGRWMVTLYGYAGETPPLELEAFRAYARSLVAGDVGQLVAGAKPLGDGATFNYPTVRLRHFERLERPVRGYLALGDALCNLSPAYGQGITSAAMQLEALDDALRRGTERLEARYYRAAVAAASVPFEISWGADAELPGVRAEPPPTPAIVRAYLRRAMRVAGDDPVVARALRNVVNLLAAPPSLLRPSIAWRVLLGSSRRVRAGESRDLAAPVYERA